MPIYEYVCKNCDTKFELRRPMSQSDATADCPSGHSGAERVLSLFAAVTQNSDGGYATLAGTGHSCDNCEGGGCANCSH
jgi:putative FmdB family regulatory protein